MDTALVQVSCFGYLWEDREWGALLWRFYLKVGPFLLLLCYVSSGM